MEKNFEYHFTIQTLEVNNFETITKVDCNMNGEQLHQALKNLMEVNESYALVFLFACADYRQKNKAGI
jgi:hypothetical protein